MSPSTTSTLSDSRLRSYPVLKLSRTRNLVTSFDQRLCDTQTDKSRSASYKKIRHEFAYDLKPTVGATP